MTEAQRQHLDVAVLLATYNGARYIEPQIASLKENATPFTLHWLDDHSADGTREAVRAAALKSHIHLREWHQPQHVGVPFAFFQLLECVEADFYLFCDQDDIWQPGKIDATVANLLPDAASTVLCFSDPLMFFENEPGRFHRQSDLFADAKAPRALQESRLFMSLIASGHTQGFTRSLRDIYVCNKDIARSYAAMHDFWMYLIAVGSGTVRLLSDVPTTLYRQHDTNFSKFITGSKSTWGLQQVFRRAVARQAAGFILASATFPPGAKLERLLAIARLVSTLDRRQSLSALVRLARRHAMWPSRRSAAWLSATCLCTDANP
jgi:glycosyltransferase involved in cell wall biosynthesis